MHLLLLYWLEFAAHSTIIQQQQKRKEKKCQKKYIVFWGVLFHFTGFCRYVVVALCGCVVVVLCHFSNVYMKVLKKLYIYIYKHIGSGFLCMWLCRGGVVSCFVVLFVVFIWQCLCMWKCICWCSCEGCIHMWISWYVSLTICGFSSYLVLNQVLSSDGETYHTNPWLSQGLWWSAYRLMHFCWYYIGKDQLPGL